MEIVIENFYTYLVRLMADGLPSNGLCSAAVERFAPYGMHLCFRDVHKQPHGVFLCACITSLTDLAEGSFDFGYAEAGDVLNTPG
jgi:hypothetical protein